MKFSLTPAYGHAFCPHCTSEFDLALAKPAVKEKLPHNDSLLYLMCQDCYEKFDKADAIDRKAMSNLCFINAKLTKVNPDGSRRAWAITTTLTLALNGYDIVNAHEKGLCLSRKEYFAICERKYEVMVIPGGIGMIFSEELKGSEK